MFGIGFNELIVILLIILLLFGGKKLPELAKSIGEGLREMKNAFSKNSDSSSPEEEK